MTCENIKDFINSKYNLDISVKNNSLDVLFYKYSYYYLCNRYALDALTLVKIGSSVNVNHASVLHGLSVFNDLIYSGKKMQIIFKDMETSLLDKYNFEEVDIYLEPKDVIKFRKKIRRLRASNKSLSQKNRTLKRKVLSLQNK